MRGEFQRARELQEQVLRLAQQTQDPALLLWAHYNLGDSLLWMGEFVPAREHQEQAITLYDPQQRFPPTHVYGGFDPRVACRSIAGLVLWHLGYPEQALKRIHEALSLAHELSYPFSLAIALNFALWFHEHRRDWQTVQELTETAIALSTEQGYPLYLASGTILRGWALAEQGQTGEGIAQIRQGLAAWRATGAGSQLSYFLALLAEACGRAEQTEEGLTLLAEALAMGDKSGDHHNEAELYRLKGELLLSDERGMMNAERRTGEVTALPQAAEAERCFQKSLDVARHQEVKSWELRAATSLARLWQQQGKKTEARDLLAPVYHWFTEGFDTADLKDAKALLHALSEGV